MQVRRPAIPTYHISSIGREAGARLDEGRGAAFSRGHGQEVGARSIVTVVGTSGLLEIVNQVAREGIQNVVAGAVRGDQHVLAVVGEL